MIFMFPGLLEEKKKRIKKAKAIRKAQEAKEMAEQKLQELLNED